MLITISLMPINNLRYLLCEVVTRVANFKQIIGDCLFSLFQWFALEISITADKCLKCYFERHLHQSSELFSFAAYFLLFTFLWCRKHLPNDILIQIFCVLKNTTYFTAIFVLLSLFWCFLSRIFLFVVFKRF